jgi:hypothetical protein
MDEQVDRHAEIRRGARLKLSSHFRPRNVLDFRSKLLLGALQIAALLQSEVGTVSAQFF